MQRHTRAPTLTSSTSSCTLLESFALVVHIVYWAQHHPPQPSLPPQPVSIQLNYISAHVLPMHAYTINNRLEDQPPTQTCPAACHDHNPDLVGVYRWLSDELSTHRVISNAWANLPCKNMKCLTTTYRWFAWNQRKKRSCSHRSQLHDQIHVLAGTIFCSVHSWTCSRKKVTRAIHKFAQVCILINLFTQT